MTKLQRMNNGFQECKKKYLKDPKKFIENKLVSHKYMYDTFSSQENLTQQATDGQHHKATTTLSFRFRKKKAVIIQI